MCSCMLLPLRSAVPCNNDSAALSVFMRFACSAACCDLAQLVAHCSVLESYGQSGAAAYCFMCVQLCYAMLITVPHALCACCDSAQFVAVWLNLMDSLVQQPVDSSVFSCVVQC